LRNKDWLSDQTKIFRLNLLRCRSHYNIEINSSTNCYSL
jgi:hypothetical protein